jgi:hypothetical protein
MMTSQNPSPPFPAPRQLFTSIINHRKSKIINQFPSVPASPCRPHRAGLDELGVDPRLAGILLPVADVIRPVRDALRHRAAVPAGMRDRWPELLEIRGHVAADQ